MGLINNLLLSMRADSARLDFYIDKKEELETENDKLEEEIKALRRIAGQAASLIHSAQNFLLYSKHEAVPEGWGIQSRKWLKENHVRNQRYLREKP